MQYKIEVIMRPTAKIVGISKRAGLALIIFTLANLFCDTNTYCFLPPKEILLF